jgi:hypothetical protein
MSESGRTKVRSWFEVGQVLAGIKIDANAALVIRKELITAADQIKLAEPRPKKRAK